MYVDLTVDLAVDLTVEPAPLSRLLSDHVFLSHPSSPPPSPRVRTPAGKVDAVAVGADRVAANGDTANKIGTLQLAIAAAHYGVPFLVVAPLTSCDPEVIFVQAQRHALPVCFCSRRCPAARRLPLRLYAAAPTTCRMALPLFCFPFFFLFYLSRVCEDSSVRLRLSVSVRTRSSRRCLPTTS